ncbi:MAG: hypothetical protein ACFFBE_07605 [Promethearchaeota archaeon]
MKKALKNLDLFKQFETFIQGKIPQELEVFVWESNTKSWRRIINLSHKIV